MSDDKRLRLTNLGDLACRHGVQTSSVFWRKQFEDVVEVMDQDGDWEQLIDERIAGLSELFDNLRKHGDSWYRLVKEG